MTSAGRLLIAASLGALAACGSSRTPAPVVYGSAPPQPAYPAGYPAASAPPYGATSVYAAGPQSPVYQPLASSAPYAQAVYSPTTSAAKLTPVAAEPLDQAPARVMTVAQTTYDAPRYQQPAYQPISAPRPGSWTTVRSGETVYAISRRTGVSPDAIIAENNLYPPYFLQVGQQIRLPGSAGPATPAYPQQPPAYQPPSYQPPAYPEPSLQPIADSPSMRRVVRPGETLFSISRETRVPVQRLADVNRLYPPYALQIGQTLLIPGREATRPAYSAPTTGGPSSIDVADLSSTISYTSPRQSQAPRLFDWPVRGAIISQYGVGSKGRRNDGVNIAAPIGTPVRAAADGEVVYRGSELDGYGNLLLVKHRDGFVTAYAHNDVMLVRKGQRVQQGQVIAKVGQTGAVSEPQLHFEIRQDLKSVDPQAFLQ